MSDERSPERTPEEREILESVAERESWEWVEKHEQHILNQARIVRELRPRSSSS